MSLTSALNTAQTIFNNTGTQSSVVSNNIANASNSNYARRQAQLTTTSAGASVVQIARAQEPSLQRQFLQSTSRDSAQQQLLQGLEDIKATAGGNDYETAPSTYLAAFQSALQAYAGSPGNMTAAQAAITAAQDVANSLNTTTTAVQQIRANADKSIASQVGTLNSLLSQFETANNAVKLATATAGPTSSALSDALDQRDTILGQISSIIGVKTVLRDNNDMAIYTSSGTTLFETLPRTVTFQATNTYTAGTQGNAVYIDGVALPTGNGSTTTGQGSLQALLQIRDTVAPTYQSQLDEIARGLVTMFSETTTTTTGAPPVTTVTSTQPGLFTWSGGTTPTGASVINGIAGTISVNPNVVTGATPTSDPARLRDGTVNAASTSKNSGNDSGYSTLLDSYVTAMDADIGFDPATGVDTSSSILDFAENSMGWLESYRSGASTAAENTTAALSRSTEAYSNETGVNLDEELSLLMDIEQSYKAGTKILNAVNDMLDALLNIAS